MSSIPEILRPVSPELTQLDRYHLTPGNEPVAVKDQEKRRFGAGYPEADIQGGGPCYFDVRKARADGQDGNCQGDDRICLKGKGHLQGPSVRRNRNVGGHGLRNRSVVLV